MELISFALQFLRLRVLEPIGRVLKFLRSRFIWESCVEVGFTLLVSNAFIAFLIFAYMLETPSAKMTPTLALKLVSNNVKSAEILVYILALVAPTLWIMMMNWRARRHAVFYALLLILQIVIVALSAYVYGRAKFGGIANQGFADEFAIWALCIGIISWLISLIYHRWLPSAVNKPRPQSGQQIVDDLGGETA